MGAIWHKTADRTKAGQVRVFDYTGSLWEQRGEDLVGETRGDWLGNSVAVSLNGNVVAAGAICRNNGWQGYVKVFEWV